MKSITFVMPCYNQLRFTKESVESLLDNADGTPMSFVFVDNGSTDGTSDYLKGVPGSTVIRNEKNLYVTPAWNQGLGMALRGTSDVVCLINNDIHAGKNWAEPVQQAFDIPGTFFIPQSNCYLKQSGFFSFEEFEEYDRSSEGKGLTLTTVDFPFPGFCMFFRREDVRLFWPIPKDFMVLRNDNWIVRKLKMAGRKPLRIDTCAVYHYGRQTQNTMRTELKPIWDRDAAAWKRADDKLKLPPASANP